MRAKTVTLALGALAALTPVAGCSRGDTAARERLFSHAEARPSGPAFDPAHPESALALDADQVSKRLGTFEWGGAADWTVAQPGGVTVHVTEQHKLRQVSSGEFEVRADVDPGLGPNAVSGKHVIWVNGMTFARALPAPFRERPTDRGRDARRYREDSFGMVRTIAALVGPALRIEANGSETILSREALRYRFTLADAAAPAAPPAPPGFLAKDPDTAARQGFLRGAAATKVEGELFVDAETGAPLRARLAATFAAPAQGKAPGPKVTVVVSSKIAALGTDVKAVAAPSTALPDERKPAGPSAALQAAGLKKKGEERQAAEPSDESE
jgi:hypothetical protein